MARTNDVLVKEVMAPGHDYDLEESPSLAPYIRAANNLVTRLVAAAAADEAPLTAQEAEDVETWLAAHFFKCSDRQVSDDTVSKGRAIYMGNPLLKGLEATTYGQTALAIDPSGLLAEIASGAPRASLTWGGKTEDEAIDYDTRNGLP